MNMRWAWTLPLLSIMAFTVTARKSPAQVEAPAQPGPAPNQPLAGMAGTPQAAPTGIPMAMMPAGAMMPPGYAPQYAYPAMPGYAAPTGYMPAPAMFAPYGVSQVAYMNGPVPAEGAMAPQVPGTFPGGPIPDVYGAYGYVPTSSGGGGYGPPGYGEPTPAGGGQPMPPGYDPGYGMSGGPMQGGPMPGSMDGYGGYGGPGMDGCPYCGGNGCGNCRGGLFGHHGGGHGSHLPNGLLGDVLGLVAPYPDGGCAAVRWFDVAIDYMALKRDNTGRSDQLFATRGVTGVEVLTANDLDFGSYRPGFRLMTAFQVGPANSIDFTYFGQLNYTSSATARNPNSNLYGVYSDFGRFLGGVFQEYNDADFQQIDYMSTFDSFEVNWRNRWMAPNCRYQGSWTLGVRHFVLDETFTYASSSIVNGFLPARPGSNFTPARGTTDTVTTNNLTGLQVGTDLWVCLLPGLRAGGEFQAGVYGNHMNINTTIGSNVPNTPDFLERLEANDVSFIGQLNLLTTYRINYQWTLRGGYQFLYVDGVALAVENFNPVPPFFNNFNNPREQITNDNGNVFYHGWNVGLEFMW